MHSTRARIVCAIAAAFALSRPIGQAATHDREGMRLLRCLGRARAFIGARVDPSRCTNELQRFAGADQAATVAEAGQSGIRASYAAYLAAGQGPPLPGLESVPVPFGLGDYEYALALRAQAAGDRVAAAGLFGRALIDRSTGWPPAFYDRYRAVLETPAPPAAARDQRSEPEIRLGRKDQPAWYAPMMFASGSQLLGFTIDQPADLDRQLPAAASWYWERNHHRVAHTEALINIAPNGSFELGSSAPVPLGWHAPRGGVTTHSADIDGRISRLLVLAGEGPGIVVTADTALIPLPLHADRLLWSVWAHSAPRGNPHFFALWFDGNRKLLSFDLPLQGTPPVEGSRFAGTVTAPPKAVYVVIRLANWMTDGDVEFDDVVLSTVPDIDRTR